MVDETFRLEADHLAWTIREIQQMIRLLEEEGQDLNGRGLPGGKTGALDREDRKWSQALCQEAKRKFAQADLLRAAISSPYFRRLDIETVDGSGVSIATYVGKQPVAATDAPYDAEQFLVHDWREPRIMQLGSKDTAEFEGVRYRLWLRRDLTVDGGVLKDYSDSYLSRDEDTLSDPYLLSMLSHARGQAELTDIIRSIQRRQNEIICHDGSRSFIVQGCAGSGKTQVLLHRLSFLIYNNPDDDWERTRIITINHAFSDYIADLSHRLDIGSVPRCSLEEYYLELISRLTGSAWDVPVAESEEVLPEEFLERVYSPAFRAEMEGSWDAAWEQAREVLRRPETQKLAERRGIPLPSSDSKAGPYASKAWRDFAARITSYESVGSWEKALAKAQEGITTLADRLSLLRKEQAEAREGITAAACAVHEKANRLRADLSVMPLELFGAAQQVSLMQDIEARTRAGLTIPDDLMEDFRGGSAYAPLLAYNKAADAAAAAGERLEKERQRALRIQERIAAMKDDALTEEERVLASEIRRTLGGTSFRAMHQAVFGNALRSLHRQHGIATEKNEDGKRIWYRHELYLRLVAAKLYYGVPGRREKALYIDEAQELAPAEYMLLQEINGRGCAMELYGDVHQGRGRRKDGARRAGTSFGIFCRTRPSTSFAKTTAIPAPLHASATGSLGRTSCRAASRARRCKYWKA